MSRKLTTLSLSALVTQLGDELPMLTKVSLFGSRRYKTGSPRSDIDLLLFFSDNPPPTTVAEVTRRVSTYIDAFVLLDEEVAESVINGSHILTKGAARTVEELVDAEPIWSRGGGFSSPGFESQQFLRDFDPWYTVAELQGDRAARRAPIDYLVVTALDDEFVAMEDALKPYVVDSDPQLGMLGRQLIARIPHPPAPQHDQQLILCQSDRMGNIASGLTTAEALTRWAPRLVVLVGITGGISGRVRLGDVVVADRVLDYEAVKVTRFGSLPHGIKCVTSPRARQRAMSWKGLSNAVERLELTGGPGQVPRIVQAGFASGEKVVASRRLTRRITRQDRKVAAIEMESLGVADACRREGVEHFVFKAVTDYCDRRKSDDYRDYCCQLAAGLMVNLLRGRVLLQ